MPQRTIVVSSIFNDKAKLAAKEELAEDTTVETKRQLWEDMGNELEISGYPKHKISVKIQNTIEAILREESGYEIKINTRHYYRVMEKNNWQDESFIHHTKKIDALGHRENSSIYTGINSELVEFLAKMEKTIKRMQEKCKTLTDNDGNPLEIKEQIPKASYDTIIGELHEVNNIIDDENDDKSKVPQRLHHLFKTILQQQSGMFAVAKSFAYSRLYLLDHVHAWLTKKQANKFKLGVEPNQLPMYKPRTTDQALFMGFFGQQCNKCKSYRVRETVEEGLNSKLYCIDCENVFDVVIVCHCKICQIPWYTEDIAKMTKKGKCVSCKSDVRIPEELKKLVV